MFGQWWRPLRAAGGPAREGAVLLWAALRLAAVPDVDVVDEWVPAALATAAPPPASEPTRASEIRSLRIRFHLLSWEATIPRRRMRAVGAL